MATGGDAPKRGELRYAMVSRGVDVLAEHSMVKGDLSATVQECLAVLPKDRATYIAMPYGDFIIAFQTEKEYVFGVLADKEVARDVLRGFLGKLQSGFMPKYGSKARAMPAGALQREFGPKLKQQLKEGTARPEELSKLVKIKGQVEEVKGVMVDNIRKVINRGEKLEVLNEQANALQEQAGQFKKEAKKVKTKMWWENMKIKIVIILILLLLLGGIVSLIACRIAKC
ncbi:unnamed protein product [Closterium sp. NIES-64]|nr:unnamed protein product [Closterium sp. Naga37s-1]CAI5493267.1 unnamed protein product [Closterium sp. Naga37s-1]CAI5981039.1 unnamed protein product [Closterium sp. NIES-64]